MAKVIATLEIKNAAKMANGKKPQIIFLTSEQHKQIDRERKEIVPGEEITVETIYGIQIISDEVRTLDLRYEENENENPRTD